MLTTDILKKQTGLEGLTDEQLGAIVQLSNNDAKADIESKVREAKGKLRGDFDNDIKNLFGYDNDGKPTYQYLINSVNKFKEEHKGGGDNSKEIEARDKKIADLEAKIKAGGNTTTLQAELDKQTALVEQLRKDQDNIHSDWQTKYDERETKYKGSLVANEYSKASAKLKFKSESLVPLFARDAAFEKVQNELSSEFETQFNDKGVLEYLKDGQVYRNPNNKQEPYTTVELLTERLEPILDTGKQQGGGGAKGGGKQQGGSLNLAEATTQVAVDEIIITKLQHDGLVKGTEEFSNKWTELRKTVTDFDKLPET